MNKLRKYTKLKFNDFKNILRVRKMFLKILKGI